MFFFCLPPGGKYIKSASYALFQLFELILDARLFSTLTEPFPIQAFPAETRAFPGLKNLSKTRL